MHRDTPKQAFAARDAHEALLELTLPVHDAGGKIIATAGIDFKPWPDQAEAWVTERSEQIAKETRIQGQVKRKTVRASGLITGR